MWPLEPDTPSAAVEQMHTFKLKVQCQMLNWNCSPPPMSRAASKWSIFDVPKTNYLSEINAMSDSFADNQLKELR